MHKNILIIADIEGSSLCNDYAATCFLGKGWPAACMGMTLDVNEVVSALFKAGAETIYVKDFHRTGYNLIPHYIDSRATLISGYEKGPVPGIGSPRGATGLMLLGMHAPSGSDGFLAHTLTSRISCLEVNGKPMSEAQLFSASLAPFHLHPLFFSGCPVACQTASKEIKHLRCFPIDKSNTNLNFNPDIWRKSLAEEAVTALLNSRTTPYMPKGPFSACVTMKEGENAALKIAGRWGFDCKEDRIYIQADTIHTLYMALIKLAYFTPFTLKTLPLGLPFYNSMGWAGLKWITLLLFFQGLFEQITHTSKRA